MLPTTDMSVLHLGAFEVPTQGALAALGVGLGVTLFVRRLQHPRAETLATLAVVGALIGGHALGMWLAPTTPDWRALASQQSSLGALLGASAVAVGLARLWHLPRAPLTDAAAWAFLHGWPLVRLGCVLVHDHLGRMSTSFLSVQTGAGSRLDVGAVEALGTVILLATVRVWLRGRSVPPWRLAAVATLGFAGLRLIVEVLRGDAMADVFFHRGSKVSVALCLVGLGLGTWFWQKSTARAQLHPPA